MLRSLYSGVSGMKNSKARMDVVGNNIANVNTTGFKSGRVNFQDALSQYYSNNAVLGKNQVGTGVNVATISNDFTPGPMQNTGRTLDLAIEGDGFFQVKPSSGADGTERYTRDGVFFINESGEIVNSSGLVLEGTATITKPGEIATLDIASDGKITGTYNDGTSIDGGTIKLYKFANREGLSKAGGNLYMQTTESGDAEEQTANVKIASGYLEMSNVDLSQEMVDVMTSQRGFQANARTITVSDTLLEELINLKR